MQESAAGLPCSALSVSPDAGAIRIAGFAGAGQDFDRLLARLRDNGRLLDQVTRLDRLYCAVVEVLAPAIRATGSGGLPVPAIRIDPPAPASGARVAVSVSSASPALYIDLFQPDGTVRHLLRPSRAGGMDRRSAEWTAATPGSRLVLAAAAELPLQLGNRPETERASDYLDALRGQLQDADNPVAASFGSVTVRPAEPVAARAPLRSNNARPEKCANIVSRVQLGETLSDADLAMLRGECRS